MGSARDGSGRVRRFALTVAEGPRAGHGWESAGDRSTVGSHPSNDVVVDDPTVSRFHCEVWMDPDGGARVRDLESRNGTTVDGLRIKEAWLRDGSTVRLGRTVLRFRVGREANVLPISDRTELGSLQGVSVAMRTVFAQLERAAQSDATVLVEGETGTGKEGAAGAIHSESTRKDGPFVVVDCGAIPENLLESELFGHERGAFTGADSRRIGAFEEASGGTIFLDEIGELPAELQPKLLRALEQRQVRRVGGNVHQTVDVRVVAATNRDLRAEVNAGRFRSDLYFRLAVLKITLPPLRARPEDIHLLAERILCAVGAKDAARERLLSPETIARLEHAAWPGNVRELKNYLERCLVFEGAPVEDEADSSLSQPDDGGIDLPFVEARRRALSAFEGRYVAALLGRNRGQPIAQAARVAGIDRNYLYRLMRRHGLKE
ncbi:MAG: sigma 54-interacting transcriptional regulator [Deltaproteobacteria bacterium]|nr:sigma 54-interacting transcriptional regulator [Deltaproteobacteria bacterium]